MSKKYGLIGFKLGHSWSPMIHDYFYDQYNIDASYELIECEEKDLKDVIELLKTGKYYGFNVTIPYKVSIMKYLDEVSKEALKILLPKTDFI
jgi:shikimate dehydrogenase